MSKLRECNWCYKKYWVYDSDAGTHKEYCCSTECADDIGKEGPYL